MLGEILNYEIKIWQFIVIIGVAFILGDISYRIYAKGRDGGIAKSQTTDKKYQKFCIKKFLLHETSLERGMKVRFKLLEPKGKYVVGELIGMDYNQFIMIATTEFVTYIAYENISGVEVIDI
jgi:hypothetical protein